MKQAIIAFLLAACICTAQLPGAAAAEPSLADSVSIESLTAHAMEMYLALEGRYDSVTPRDSNALSIGFLQWHGASALKLLKRICEADPAAARATLGSALYHEVVQTPLWSAANGCGWKNRTLSSAEAAAVKALIRSEIGVACQNQFARELILEEARHGWNRGIRTEAALLYYCAVEHQYGVGGVSYFMQYVREALELPEDGLILSLDQLHNGVLEASETHSSIRNYLSGRRKVYSYLVDTLCLSAGPEDNPTPFLDLPAVGHWARAAIIWASQSRPQITGGTSATTFSPEAAVTRAEAVTFLWAAAGRPEPISTVNPFQDVAEDAYYYAPVLWAVENGVTGGTSATSFSPKAQVLREDMLTFLWAAFGRETLSELDNPFSDVSPKKYYYPAVLWATDHGVLVGNEGGEERTLLRPAEPCTRAYVVTYLFRLFQQE